MKSSIIIRTKNEAKRIGGVLKMLEKQTEKDFEVVIVDSGSSDKTLEIIEGFKDKLKIKIIKIEPQDFTYPYACNIGAKEANGQYLIYLSGHSVPINKDWLKRGLENFNNKKIGGVYSKVLPSADASIWEKILYFPAQYSKHKRKISRLKMGILGNTNAIIRTDIWRNHHFDEKYWEGGEDGEMAKYILNHGYAIIQDPDFAVEHSHGLGLIKLVKQYISWIKMYNRFK